MIGKNQEELILEIINSDKFDKEAFEKLRGFFSSIDVKGNIEAVTRMLQGQYMDIDIENIFINNDKDKIIDFLNRLIHAKLPYRNGCRKRCNPITPEELEEFKILATQADAMSEEELSKNAPLLTTRTYLEMCRTVYDVTYDWKYPDDISTAYLFCEARLSSYQEEYNHGILGIDWDSPEQFAQRYFSSYHREELGFGGPSIDILDESACIGEKLYTRPEVYGRWTGHIYCRFYDKESISEAVKIYIALRRKGYPIYFGECDKTYSEAKKLCIG